MTTTLLNSKDLTKEAPTSPRVRTGGYAILARTADKCRAFLAGTIGEYHYDCPLDNFLFDFKGVKGDAFKAEVEKGADNEALASWLNAHGTPKTAEEVAAWSAGVEGARPYDNPEKKEWFAEQCREVGIDPATSTLFDWLEKDDALSFAK